MAARFWIGGGTNTNWNASPSTNWAATSGGAVRVAAPGVTDDVTFDGAGANGNTASVVSAANSCLSLTFTGGYTNTITINTAVVLTVAGNFTDNTAHTWVVSGTGSMAISAASTIASGGKTFPGPVSFSGSNTKTLNGNWTITGTLTCATTTTTINKTASEVLSCAGWTLTGATAGTISITLTGGTWSGAGANTVTGTITLAGTITVQTVSINGATLNYSSGTITTTGGTLQLTGSNTLSTNGVTWNNITISTTSTTTINSLLSATGTLLINNGLIVTFAGTAGWTVATFSNISISSASVVLKNGITYTVTGSFSCSGSRVGSILLFVSSDATLKAILTINPTVTCSVLSSFTRIDASNGRPIHSFNGIITDCNNIFTIIDALPPARVLSVRAGATY